MANNEKILKRALEMAGRYYTNQNCYGCLFQDEEERGEYRCHESTNPFWRCEKQFALHFIRKAKEAICKGN